jgi:hypothetical protein
MTDALAPALSYAEADEEIIHGEFSLALAALLIDGVLLLGDNWHRPAVAGEISVNVICSDTFSYASADCEPLHYAEIGRVYERWRRDPKLGPTAWCAARRKQAPIAPVAKMLADAGYDVVALSLGELPRYALAADVIDEKRGHE